MATLSVFTVSVELAELQPDTKLMLFLGVNNVCSVLKNKSLSRTWVTLPDLHDVKGCSYVKL